MSGATAPVIGGQSRSAPRLAPIVVPVAIGGLLATLAATFTLATAGLDSTLVIGALILLAAAVIAEANPVPVEGVSAGGVSLAAAFLVGAALLFGWEVATLLGLLSRATIEVTQRRPLIRLAYNGATYALASAAAGIVVYAVGPHESAPDLVTAVVLASFAFYVVNVALVSMVVARASATNVVEVVVQSVRWTAVPFAIMGSISLILAVLWLQSHVLIVALVGPLVAVALYQRSVHGELEALRLAKTDPLTGLGNHRAFHERLGQELEPRVDRALVSLCLVDVDGFKRVNDRLGHQAGDLLLSALARLMPEAGDAYRIGGDEFAILIPGSTETATRALSSVLEKVTALDVSGVDAVTVSAGVATYPEHGETADALFNAADIALYHAKRHGKNRVHSFDPGVVGQGEGHESQSQRIRLAWKLTELVDEARSLEVSPFTGHPGRVADLAARIAARLESPPDEVELVRLAAALHDIGKLAVPREILAKDATLDQDELDVISEHPRIGERILSSIGAAPLAEWVLHHHERWDGKGYPSGLAGEAIPLASRIIFVADAFDAMTSERPYRVSVSPTEALSELRRCAGSQFDPRVVEALSDELRLHPDETQLVAVA